MIKAQDVLKKISEDSDLMAKYRESQNFEELHKLCKKIEPSITEKEVKDSMRKLITENPQNTVPLLSNEELAAVAGGNMDFNRTKALALSALMLTGVGSTTMFSDTAYASGSPEATSVSQKAETGTQDQKKLDQELEWTAKYGDIEAAYVCQAAICLRDLQMMPFQELLLHRNRHL